MVSSGLIYRTTPPNIVYQVANWTIGREHPQFTTPTERSHQSSWRRGLTSKGRDHMDAGAAGSDGLEHLIHQRLLRCRRLLPFGPDRTDLSLPAAHPIPSWGRRRRWSRLRRRARELVRRLARGARERPAVQQVRGHVEGSVPLLCLPLRRRERGPRRLALAAAAAAAGGLGRGRVTVRCRRRLGLHAASAASLPLLPARPAGDGEGSAAPSADCPYQCSASLLSVLSYLSAVRCEVAGMWRRVPIATPYVSLTGGVLVPAANSFFRTARPASGVRCAYFF